MVQYPSTQGNAKFLSPKRGETAVLAELFVILVSDFFRDWVLRHSSFMVRIEDLPFVPDLLN
jgi:hypothetical protein